MSAADIAQAVKIVQRLKVSRKFRQLCAQYRDFHALRPTPTSILSRNENPALRNVEKRCPIACYTVGEKRLKRYAARAQRGGEIGNLAVIFARHQRSGVALREQFPHSRSKRQSQQRSCRCGQGERCEHRHHADFSNMTGPTRERSVLCQTISWPRRLLMNCCQAAWETLIALTVKPRKVRGSS